MSFSKLHALLKKRGFLETLEVLAGMPEGRCDINTFFSKLRAMNSYYNAFLRARDDLIAINAIKYSLDEFNRKNIELTEKGHMIVDIFRQLLQIVEEE